MNKLVYLIISAVFLTGFLSSTISKVFTLIPEFLSAVAFLVILLRIAVSKTITVSPKYIVLGGLVLLHLLTGLIVNSVAPGTIVAGIRPYLKWLPLFFLPMVYSFSDREIGQQARFVLFLALLECPIAIFQRFIQYKGIASGDNVTGSLGAGGSGALSIFLLSVIAVLFAYYLKGRIRLIFFIVILCVLFLPTMINETKVTFLLLPIVLIVPYLYASRNALSVPKFAGVATLGLSLMFLFVLVYDQIVGQWGGQGIQDFMLKRVDSYLYSGIDFSKENLLSQSQIGSNMVLPEEVIGTKEGGGRLDKILLPINTLSNQPIKFWLGLGIGNVSTSVINIFSGEYTERLGAISGESLLSFLLWETGIGGVFLLLLFVLFLLVDAHKVSKLNNSAGIFASGWMGVLVIYLIAVPYINFFYFNTLIFLFAYFSGYIVSKAGHV